MKNRAKCKLCQSIIESFHPTDYVECNCGEISVEGGDSLRCASKDWKNFVRVDDQSNEIVVKIFSDDVSSMKPTKVELIKMLSDHVKAIENLPPHAMSTPVTHYDLYASLLIVLSIVKEDFPA